MKPSKFNLFFVHEGYHIGFNSFSSEYIMLEDMLYQMYDSSVKVGSFDELREVHPDFYAHLVEKKFLVESSLDEVALVKEVSFQIDNDESQFELHINPTMNCNFKCWYCYETHIKDSKMDESTILSTKNFISKVFNEKALLNKFHLGWFGGEPLLYFNKVIVPILISTYEAAQEKNISFSSSITTNGLLVTEDVIEISKKFGLDFYQITLDGYKEKHDKVRFISEGKGSYERIVANIFSLAKHGIHVNVRVNIDKDTLIHIKEIATDFASMNIEDRKFISFDLHKVWQITEDIDQEIFENRQYFRKCGFNVSSGTHNTVANSCYGDHKNHATINYNGEVFKCTARDFTTSNSEGKLEDDGTIVWNEKLATRLSSKFKNKPCLECRILPMCGGGCSQQAIEHQGVDYCVFDFDENKKLDVVKNKFAELLAEM
jgi:uncharacterized protein